MISCGEAAALQSRMQAALASAAETETRAAAEASAARAKWAAEAAKLEEENDAQRRALEEAREAHKMQLKVCCLLQIIWFFKHATLHLQSCHATYAAVLQQDV
jgi:cell division septum initiation protein DivIVA